MKSRTSKTYRSAARIITEEAAWEEGLRIIGFFRSIGQCYSPPANEVEKNKLQKNYREALILTCRAPLKIWTGGLVRWMQETR